jgi:hypothetical protein
MLSVHLTGDEAVFYYLVYVFFLVAESWLDFETVRDFRLWGDVHVRDVVGLLLGVRALLV